MMYRRVMLACSLWLAWSVPSSAKYRNAVNCASMRFNQDTVRQAGKGRRAKRLTSLGRLDKMFAGARPCLGAPAACTGYSRLRRAAALAVCGPITRDDGG